MTFDKEQLKIYEEQASYPKSFIQSMLEDIVGEEEKCDLCICVNECSCGGINYMREHIINKAKEYGFNLED